MDSDPEDSPNPVLDPNFDADPNPDPDNPNPSPDPGPNQCDAWTQSQRTFPSRTVFLPSIRILTVALAQRIQNLVFLGVFIFEFSIKHIGLGYRVYWSDLFNCFDGLVVLVSIVFAIVPGGAIAGLFRIGRVFRLIRRAPQLHALMTSMISTIPAITNVFAVMLLLFFIYAVRVALRLGLGATPQWPYTWLLTLPPSGATHPTPVASSSLSSSNNLGLDLI